MAPSVRREHRLPSIAAPAAVVVALAGAGCKVGPDYERPEAAFNSTWLDDARGAAGEGAAAPAWWETFQDPTLDALIQAARASNLTLRVAGLRVIEARAQRGIAVGEFFPQLQQAFGNVGAHKVSNNDAFPAADRNYATASVGLE